MKVVQINCVYARGSTGRIAQDLHNIMIQEGIESKVVYGYGQNPPENAYRMQNMLEFKYNIGRGRITGRHGYYNIHATKKMIKWLEQFNPDVIHLHNIHGYYINVPLLFDYIRKNNKPVVWTFHDCWPFTGHCAYFDVYGCEQWKNGCKHCAAWNEYKIIMKDRCEKNWKEKKKWFEGLSSVKIITPSNWLADFVKESYLQQYPIDVIHNGIDTSIFKPTKSNLREELGIKGKKVLLGIVPDLNGTKGGRYLVELAERLGTDFAVVILSLVTHEKLPPNVYVLPRTNDIKKLAEIYSMADIFVNPTMQDNYPTVNLEAAACKTPVITFDTGGSPEGIQRGFGEVVEKGNVEKMQEAIYRWTNIDKKTIPCNFDRNSFDKKNFAEKYIDVYKSMMKK